MSRPGVFLPMRLLSLAARASDMLIGAGPAGVTRCLASGGRVAGAAGHTPLAIALIALAAALWLNTEADTLQAIQ